MPPSDNHTTSVAASSVNSNDCMALLEQKLDELFEEYQYVSNLHNLLLFMVNANASNRSFYRSLFPPTTTRQNPHKRRLTSEEARAVETGSLAG